jgi:DNA-binding NtrC family response regulator
MAPAAKKKSSASLTEPIPDGLMNQSDSMQPVNRLVSAAAKVDVPVLFLGEPGTGKTTLAASLHQQSERAPGPWVAVTCSSLTEAQLEHQLFGQGVSSGCFELAEKGSLLIDEIHALPLRLQSRLLSVLQDGCFERPGESGPIRVDVRLIASTTEDLTRLVTEGKFREDLYWRLSVLPISVPPLRRRSEEIQPLVEHFLKAYSAKHQQAVTHIDPESLKALQNYQWPGNLRELQNYIERAVVLATGERLTLDLLPSPVAGDTAASQSAVFRPSDEQSLIREYVYHRISKLPAEANDLHQQIVEPVEKELISQILEACQNTQTKAANRLGINRNTLYKKMVEFGLIKQADDE